MEHESLTQESKRRAAAYAHTLSAAAKPRCVSLRADTAHVAALLDIKETKILCRLIFVFEKQREGKAAGLEEGGAQGGSITEG